MYLDIDLDIDLSTYSKKITECQVLLKIICITTSIFVLHCNFISVLLCICIRNIVHVTKIVEGLCNGSVDCSLYCFYMSYLHISIIKITELSRFLDYKVNIHNSDNFASIAYVIIRYYCAIVYFSIPTVVYLIRIIVGLSNERLDYAL